MSIIDSLNNLQNNLNTAKQVLVNNISAKGVSVTTADTLTDIANSVLDIPQEGGGGTVVGDVVTDWSSIGYNTVPQSISEAVNISKQIYDEWNPNASFPLNFDSYKNMVYFPKLPIENLPQPNAIYCSGNINLTYMPKFSSHNIYLYEKSFQDCDSLLELDASDWGSSETLRWCFYGADKITKIILPTSRSTLRAEGLYNTFSYCKSLKEIQNLDKLDTSNCTTFQETFGNCKELTSIDVSVLKINALTTLKYMFKYCEKLTTINISGWDTSKVTDIYQMFDTCTALEKVIGFLDLSSIGAMSDAAWLVGYSYSMKMNQITFKNIGFNPNQTAINNSRLNNWGVNSDEVPDARQSIIDSLITYSFDRASAGYSNCTITLASNTKAVLTEEEIAQITSKGYTIA